jgi:hypothetical protein
MKMAIVASLLLVSMQTSSAQYYDNYNRPVENFYYQNSDSAAAENELRDAKALRDKARKEREETGKSDVDARLRLQEACARAIERGVEEDVRRSYCGQSSSYMPSGQQQPSGPAFIYPPSVQQQPAGPAIVYPPSVQQKSAGPKVIYPPK